MKKSIILIFFIVAVNCVAQTGLRKSVEGEWASSDFSTYMSFFPNDSLLVISPFYYYGKWTLLNDSILHTTTSRDFLDSFSTGINRSFKLLTISSDSMVLRDEQNKFILEKFFPVDKLIKNELSLSPHSSLIGTKWELRSIKWLSEKRSHKSQDKQLMEKLMNKRYRLIFLDSCKGVFVKKDLGTDLFYWGQNKERYQLDDDMLQFFKEDDNAFRILKHQKNKLIIQSFNAPIHRKTDGVFSYKKLKKF
jgi:hypothetical protein